jgi:hypothetical protein
MHSKFLAYFFLAMLPVGCAFGCAYEGEVVQKLSRPRPDTSLPGTEGIHSFVFRGPMGTSRRPITLPGPEFWSEETSGKHAFYLRDRGGNAHWQSVTPEVFARYQEGDYFNDRQTASPREKYSEDSKAVRPVVHHRRRIAQMRSKPHRRLHRALANHRLHHSPNRIARM